MNPDRIALVQRSWRELKPDADMVAATFYGRLFAIEPALRPLFRHDLKAQGGKLMAALDFVVEGLPDLDVRLAAVQALARRHVGYGVQPGDYDRVGEALLWTLCQGLGADEGDPRIAAWAEAFGIVAAAMKSAAWPGAANATEWSVQAD